MILRGNDRLRVFLMGASAVGLFGAQYSWGIDKFPMPKGAKKAAPASQAQPSGKQPPAELPNSTEAVIITVAKTQTSGKSEVQRQLELLYQQDGREMPDMNMDIQPVPVPTSPNGDPNAGAQTSPPNAGANPSTLRTQRPMTQQATQPAQAQPGPVSQSPMPQQPQPIQPQQSSASAASQNPVAGFLRKVFIGKPKEKTSAPPSDYRPDVAPMPPETNTASQGGRPPARLSPEYAPAQLQRPAQQQLPVPQQVQIQPQTPALSNVPQAMPSPTNVPQTSRPMVTANASTMKSVRMNPQLPALDEEPHAPIVATLTKPLPPQTLLVQTSELPPLLGTDSKVPPLQSVALPPMLVQPMTTLPPPAPSTSQLAIEPLKDPSTALSMSDRSEIGNPFTEMSESEADKKVEPFTGLTLDDDLGSAAPKLDVPAEPQVAKAAAAGSETPAEQDPFADELRKMGIVPPGSVTSPETASKLEVPGKQDAPVVTIPSDSPSFDGIEDEATREKMKKIHERGSMKGLKGFCPVTLRDQRELIDAKPDFHSTYRGQKFHFADADAKLKFDEDPSRYAPAAYGADVVALTRDKDVVEGSLDFAAWYQGRLYLFGAQEAHDTFVADPAKYATPVGIE